MRTVSISQMVREPKTAKIAFIGVICGCHKVDFRAAGIIFEREKKKGQCTDATLSPPVPIMDTNELNLLTPTNLITLPKVGGLVTSPSGNRALFSQSIYSIESNKVLLSSMLSHGIFDTTDPSVATCHTGHYHTAVN